MRFSFSSVILMHFLLRFAYYQSQIQYKTNSTFFYKWYNITNFIYFYAPFCISEPTLFAIYLANDFFPQPLSPILLRIQENYLNFYGNKRITGFDDFFRLRIEDHAPLLFDGDNHQIETRTDA